MIKEIWQLIKSSLKKDILPSNLTMHLIKRSMPRHTISVALRLIVTFFVIWAGGLILSFLFNFSLNGTIDYIIVLLSRIFDAMGYPESLHWKNFSILSCLFFTTLLLWLIVSYGLEKKEPSNLYANLPTEGREQIVDSFLEENTVIDRTADVYGFIKKLFLLKGGKCNVIALDGKWGCGKSTFVGHVILLKTLMFDDEAKRWGVDYEKKDLPDLDKWMELRERCNNICKKCKERGDSDDGKIKFSLNDEYLYYDAWKNDSIGDDPIISLLCEIVEEKKSKFGKRWDDILNRMPWKAIFFVSLVLFYVASFLNCREDAKGNWAEWIMKAVPLCASFISVIAASIKEFWKSDLIDIQGYVDKEFKNKIFQEKTNTLLHEKISTVLSDELKKRAKSRFIIFIDELDRCNPLFAVKVLERVKHYFDNPNLVFVFSVNLEQLQHTIKKVYGHDFDAIHYVHRFFTEQDELPIVDMSLFIENQLFGKKKKTEESKDEQKGAENE